MTQYYPNTPNHKCSLCSFGSICHPFGLCREDSEKLASLVQERIKIIKGNYLYRIGDPVTAVYSIRSGSMKTELQNVAGQMQITGFFLAGELLGLDGIASGRQYTNAIALEDTEVCVMRLTEMEDLSASIPSLHKQVYRLMSKEIGRAYNMTLSLAAMSSEQRVATFLMSFSKRLHDLGYSATEFILRMKRADIGNYLGLTLETVSRILSRFAKEKYIEVHQKHIRLLDRAALQAIIDQQIKN